jgi:hypothetical protein
MCKSREKGIKEGRKEDGEQVGNQGGGWPIIAPSHPNQKIKKHHKKSNKE